MFYEFRQNNSGGYFDVDENLCHRLYIEADTQSEAISKAEELGCYWDGVDNGIDCPCCGDRWDENCNEIDIKKYQTEVWVNSSDINKWNKRYGKYNIIESPSVQKFEPTNEEICSGKISFKDIEEYVQYIVDEYHATAPDARIFYKNGNVKEIFTEGVR